MERLRRFITILAISCAALGATPHPGAASQSMTAMFEDTVSILDDPTARLNDLRQLGVQQIRLFVPWNRYAPKAGSFRRPRNFNAADPKAYGPVWDRLDAAVTQAAADGISVDLDPGPGAPLWAVGPGVPKDKPHPSWAPSAGEYKAFVTALATRYSGNYNPVTQKLAAGDPADLPRIHFWSIWNEPNYGPSLAPQSAPGHKAIERAPWLYRDLVDAAWSALHHSGHAHDTILFGEVAPRGDKVLGLFDGMKPLQFLRAMYCVDAHWRQLRGTAALARGCPADAAGSRAFRSRHPALFQASGFADHMYSRWYPPNVEAHPNPDYSALAQIGNLTSGLDRLQRIYGSGTRFPVWNTEYGYLTSPPKRTHPPRYIPTISQTTAAYFLNWAEYISWRNPRIASTMQYLYGDPLPALKSNDYGGYASGLLNYNGTKKPTFYAYRMPLYMPVTSGRRGASLEVWGCARPAYFAALDVPAEPQTIDIEFKPSGTGSFRVVKRVTIGNPRGYVDTRVSFASSGTVRLAWSYPSDDPLLTGTGRIFSRNVPINLR